MIGGKSAFSVITALSIQRIVVLRSIVVAGNTFAHVHSAVKVKRNNFMRGEVGSCPSYLLPAVSYRLYNFKSPYRIFFTTFGLLAC